MLESIRSHAFFVGNLPPATDLTGLDRARWKMVVEDEKSYGFLCSYFRKSHVDAMVEAVGQKRPDFLNAVHHYRLAVDKDIPFSLFDSSKGVLEVLDEYKLHLVGLHLYSFPLGITLFAIEVDDSGSSLDELTKAHAKIRELTSEWDSFSSAFVDALAPILELVPGKNKRDLIARGNKLKLFQILLVDQSEWKDELLYEIATCIPVNVVGTTHFLAPSDEFYQSMVKENTIAPFKDWKSMSMMDSYTALFKNEGAFDEEKWKRSERNWILSYYQLIYLRVLVQKTFLSSRNDQYRLNQASTSLIHDLSRMEKYYFYDNISYNFLPDMLNKQIEKGLGIPEEQEELSEQIKESESKKMNMITGIVSAFAVFSIAFDFYGILKAATGCDSAVIPSVIGLIATLAIVYLVFRLTRRR